MNNDNDLNLHSMTKLLRWLRYWLGWVVLKANSVIHRILIFSNFLNMFSKTHIEVQHFRVEVISYLLQIQYIPGVIALRLSAAVEKITIP